MQVFFSISNRMLRPGGRAVLLTSAEMKKFLIQTFVNADSDCDTKWRVDSQHVLKLGITYACACVFYLEDVGQ